MARIGTESRRMAALVEDLLLLARLDQGRPLRARPVDLSPARRRRRRRRARGRARTADRGHVEPGVVVTGDEDRLRQVVGNLLANVRVHTPAGDAGRGRRCAADGRRRASCGSSTTARASTRPRSTHLRPLLPRRRRPVARPRRQRPRAVDRRGAGRRRTAAGSGTRPRPAAARRSWSGCRRGKRRAERCASLSQAAHSNLAAGPGRVQRTRPSWRQSSRTPVTPIIPEALHEPPSKTLVIPLARPARRPGGGRGARRVRLAAGDRHRRPSCPAAESPRRAPPPRPKPELKDTALTDVLDKLVADGTITEDQQQAILDAVQAEREPGSPSARPAGGAQAQREQLGFLADGVITQEEFDQLPADSPLRQLTRSWTTARSRPRSSRDRPRAVRLAAAAGAATGSDRDKHLEDGSTPRRDPEPDDRRLTSRVRPGMQRARRPRRLD